MSAARVGNETAPAPVAVIINLARSFTFDFEDDKRLGPTVNFDLTPLCPDEWQVVLADPICSCVAVWKICYFALPTVSAMTAPRAPRGFSPRTVESRAVWCSISEFSCAPNRITIAEIHIHIIMPMPAPSEP